MVSVCNFFNLLNKEMGTSQSNRYRIFPILKSMGALPKVMRRGVNARNINYEQAVYLINANCLFNLLIAGKRQKPRVIASLLKKINTLTDYEYHEIANKELNKILDILLPDGFCYAMAHILQHSKNKKSIFYNYDYSVDYNYFPASDSVINTIRIYKDKSVPRLSIHYKEEVEVSYIREAMERLFNDYKLSITIPRDNLFYRLGMAISEG